MFESGGKLNLKMLYFKMYFGQVLKVSCEGPKIEARGKLKARE